MINHLPAAAKTLPTPVAIVDLAVVRANARRMAARAQTLRVRLRPHFKTHKCVEIARLQATAGASCFTVSTLAEARALAAAGCRDLTLAVPIAPQRLDEAADLAADLDHLALLVDHPAVAAAAANCAHRHRRRLELFMEVDCGHHRSGVDPDGRSALTLAHQLASSNDLVFRGLLTHAGQAYSARDRAALEEVARVERSAVTGLTARLRLQGVAVPEISVGSTPTVAVVDHLQGVTEIRPGNAIFYDAFQVAIGSCAADHVAFTVLTTVISQAPERGEVVVDAGALALSKDPGPTHVDPACGYGTVTTVDGRPLRELKVVALSQEHGVIRAAPGTSVERWSPGERLRIVPNHSCLAAALFPSWHVVDGDDLVAEWRPVRGW